MNATVHKTTELTALLYPVCECGKPWAEHGTCGGYKPSRPIQNLGTIAFRSQDPIANFLWKIEKFVQKFRFKRINSCHSA